MSQIKTAWLKTIAEQKVKFMGFFPEEQIVETGRENIRMRFRPEDKRQSFAYDFILMRRIDKHAPEGTRLYTPGPVQSTEEGNVRINLHPIRYFKLKRRFS